MRAQRRDIGLAIVGCGTIGRIRAEFAWDYPGIGRLGLCDTNAEAGEKLAVGIVGTEGVIDIEDTHRDLVMATEKPIGAGYTSRNYKPEFERHVDFLTSYPSGDIDDGQLWGPMRDETISWFGRIHTGLKTPHASAADGHRNLLLTMAMDLSAKRGAEIRLPLDLDELYK